MGFTLVCLLPIWVLLGVDDDCGWVVVGVVGVTRWLSVWLFWLCATVFVCVVYLLVMIWLDWCFDVWHGGSRYVNSVDF